MTTHPDPPHLGAASMLLGARVIPMVPSQGEGPRPGRCAFPLCSDAGNRTHVGWRRGSPTFPGNPWHRKTSNYCPYHARLAVEHDAMVELFREWFRHGHRREAEPCQGFCKHDRHLMMLWWTMSLWAEERLGEEHGG